MPFDKQLYAVNFNNGNLQPHVNTNSWPDMVVTPSDPAIAETSPHPLGLRLRIKPTEGTGASIDVVLLPPGGLDFDTRLLTRTTFDLPFAEGRRLDPGGPIEGEVEPIARPRDDQSQTDAYDQAGGSLASAIPAQPVLSVPEPWAVALNFSRGKILSPADAIVTCQFRTDGVRLNTPGPLQIDPATSQPDKASLLISPLDYRQFEERAHRLAHFTLEHSFCGYNAEANEHTAGCGFLTIAIPVFQGGTISEQVLRDHRVYTSNKLTSVSPPITAIPSLGVSIATQTGIGNISVRLRSFSVWINEKLP